jgi:hypothetical protein
MIQELRQYRDPIFHTAYFDTVGTAGIGYLIAKKMDWSKTKTITGLFVLGHLTHMMLGIETKLNKVTPQDEETH